MSHAVLGSRALFPDLEAEVYLNHAAISPLSTPVRGAMEAAVARIASKGMEHYFETAEAREELRAQVARFVGTGPESVAFTPNTTHGISAIALCLPWRERDRVLLFDGEFPANVTPWLQAAKLFNLEPVWLSARDALADEGSFLSAVEDELRRGVRLVALSAVQFQTGHTMPIAALGELCRLHGAELFVDAIQALGVLPFDVSAMGVDYMASGCHKWLMGLEGSGILTIAPERLDSLRPLLAGWLSHEEGLRFLFEGAGHLRYDRPIKREAMALEGGMQSVLHNAALGASLDLLESLGVDQIQGHVSAWHDALEPHLEPLGLESLRAQSPGSRSGTLSARVPPAQDLGELISRLRERGVAASSPDGCLRFAPHWPNSLDEVPQVIEALRWALS